MKLAGCLVFIVLAVAPSDAIAQSATFAGSLRNYNLLRLQDAPARPDAGRDIDFFSGRVISEITFTEHVKVESHVVFDAVGPAQSAVFGLRNASSQTYLPLDHDFVDNNDVKLTGRFDRLNLRVHTATVDLKVGRQAITWGVNTLYPSLDAFAPNLPTQIDRDYKSGVDAVRLTVSPVSHLDVEVVGAQLESGPIDPTAVGVLVRVNAGAIDFGVLGGRFYGDTRAGAYASVSVAGTGLRGEVSRTTPGDPIDRLRRPSFWRAGLGVDRQLSSKLTLSAELAYDEFGERRPEDYLLVLASARYQRGELPGPAQFATGGTLAWHFHPLGTLTTLALVNLNDGSTAVMPLVSWSVTSHVDILGGVQVLTGPPPTVTATGTVTPRSEYGGFGSAAVTGVKVYF
jgi:hypothetical protein